jgi:hypothetical protein
MKLICFFLLYCIFLTHSKIYINTNDIKYSFYDCKGAQRPYYAFLSFECSHFNGIYITASCNQTHLITRVHSDIHCQNFTETVAYGILKIFLNHSGRTNCTKFGFAADCRKTPFSYGYDGKYLTVGNFGMDSTCNISNIKTFTEFEREGCYIEGNDSIKYTSVQNFITLSPLSFYHWRYKNNHDCKGSEVETISEVNDICIKTKRGYLQIAMGVSNLNFSFFFLLTIILGILF